MNLSAIEKDWKARGFSFGVWEDSAGRRWEGYVHETDELFMLVEGEVELEMNGTRLPLKPGKEIFIPARVSHSVRTSAAGPSRWLYGYFNAKASSLAASPPTPFLRGGAGGEQFHETESHSGKSQGVSSTKR